MAGCLGRDAFGDASEANLRDAGVDTGMVARSGDAPSGVALITVDANASNRIVVVPGTNGLVTPAMARSAVDAAPDAAILMVQLEIPLESVLEAMRAAAARGVWVLLDPAPAQELPDGMLALADFVTPNQHEAEILTGVRVGDRASARMAAEALRRRGARTAIVKLGADGVMMLGPDGETFVGGHRVSAVDTTAAGDAFAGGFAAALARGANPGEALRHANAVGALSVTRFGAQPSMPTADEVERFMHGRA
jgi:ribokinase